MILFKHRHRAHCSEHFDACRWVLDLSLTKSSHMGVFLSYAQQLLSASSKEWSERGPYFCLSLSTHFAWGSEHIYYDGPHCSFSLGFLHFAWSYWWCKKCLADA